MATAKNVQIDNERNAVDIQVTVHDADLVSYLNEFEKEEHSDVVERILRVGTVTLQLSETSKDLEYVRREFESMRGAFDEDIDEVRDELEELLGDEGTVSKLLDSHLGDDGTLRDHLDEAFGKDGELAERLHAELGEDGSTIQKAFDPDNEGSPTYRLKRAIQDDIQSLRDEVIREEGRQEAKERSWEKGAEFEEKLGSLLDDLVYGTQDTVEHTGDSEGELPGRDVGDFVATIGETGQRVAIEAKSKQMKSSRKIIEEMEEAIENRDADYGIFVTQCESYVPKKIGYFQEYDRQILCVALSEDVEDELEPAFLNIAWNWTKMRALQAHIEGDDSIDSEAIQAQVDSIRKSIDRFKNVKRKCTSIEDTAREIKNTLDEIRDSVNSELIGVTTELSKTSDST